MPLPLLAAAGIAGGSALIGGGLSAWGQKSAADAAAAAGKETAAKNAATAQAGYDQSAKTLTPYTGAGVDAMGKLSDLSSGAGATQYGRTGAFAGPSQFDPSTVNVNSDPGVAYRLAQSTKALDTSAAGKGALFSGAQQKALQENAQNLASQEYQAAFNRDKGVFDSNFANANKVFLDQQAQANLQQGRKTADTQFQASAGLNAAGQLVNAGTANTTAQIGANNQFGTADAARRASGGLMLANLGGTLSSAGADFGKAMA